MIALGFPEKFLLATELIRVSGVYLVRSQAFCCAIPQGSAPQHTQWQAPPDRAAPAKLIAKSGAARSRSGRLRLIAKSGAARSRGYTFIKMFQIYQESYLISNLKIFATDTIVNDFSQFAGFLLLF